MEIKCHLDIEHSDKFLMDIRKIIEEHHPDQYIEEVTIMAHTMEDSFSADITNEYLVVDIDGDEIEISNQREDKEGKERDFLWNGPFNQRHDTFIKDRVKALLLNYLADEYGSEEG